MAKCKTIEKDVISVCIGDLNKKVVIKSRVLTPSSTGSVDYTEVFTTVATVWALVKTSVKGNEVFDGTHLMVDKDIFTHEVYIRYRSGITQENWIEYNSEHYNILDITNINEDNTFLKIRCIVRGPKANNINLA